jgi:hypothetical protein
MKAKHLLLGAAVSCVGLMSVSAYATHSWGSYHWERSSNPLNLTIINSTTSDWDTEVGMAISDWNESSVLNLTEVDGNTSNKTRRQCNGGNGTVRICNLAYGNTGWLGIAGISIDSGGHITSGYTKLNDTYFSQNYASGYYLEGDWMQSVTCQELGHNLGLDHQDEDFDNTSLKTCMDYQDPPSPAPNDHDYEQLASIYAHSDNDSGGGGGVCNAPKGKGCNKPNARGDVGWGASLGRRGNAETFIRIDPDGTMHLTHVTWAIGY